VKQRSVPSLLIFSIFLIAGSALSRDGLAHRDDYINETFVFQTLAKGEFEPEYTLDFHKTKADSDFFSNSLAFEYGITNRWMIDGIGTLKTTTDGDNSFERSRVETRYRFGEEGQHPIDMAVSLEYEFENEGEKEHFLNPRIVFSKDITPKFNTTLNLFSELRVSDFHARAGYALAMRYPAESFLRYGIEIQGLHPDPNELLIIPQIWLAFPHEITWKLGSGIYVISAEERFFFRSTFEVEF
jgi:hypothetical protein